MKRFLAATFFIAAAVGAGTAGAMPLAPLSAAAQSEIIQVAQGCGPGYARGPMGRCRPMGYGRPAIVVPPPIVVRPGRICPPGFAFRFGRCRPF